MFTPIERRDQLPAPGIANEKAHLDFKAQAADDRFEMAKDVAAFANGDGGTILVGAKGKGEFLDRYLPLARADASVAQRGYEEAVRDRCRPAPLMSAIGIRYGRGLVLAVNVWPFPGQPVGIEVKKGEAKCGRKPTEPEGLYYYPMRVGSHAKGISPEQMSMFMDARARRIAACLSQACGDMVLVTSSERRGNSHWLELARVESVDPLGNSVTIFLKGRLTSGQVSIPIDAIDTVWRSNDRWNMIIAGRMEEVQWLPGVVEPELENVKMFFAPKP